MESNAKGGGVGLKKTNANYLFSRVLFARSVSYNPPTHPYLLLMQI